MRRPRVPETGGYIPTIVFLIGALVFVISQDTFGRWLLLGPDPKMVVSPKYTALSITGRLPE